MSTEIAAGDQVAVVEPAVDLSRVTETLAAA